MCVYMETTTHDEESQARGIWGKQGASEFHADPNSGKQLGSASAGSWYQSERASGEICTRAGRSVTSYRRADTITGGILRQLINQARDQKALLEAQAQKLGEQIDEWEGLLDELIKRVDENP